MQYSPGVLCQAVGTITCRFLLYNWLTQNLDESTDTMKLSDVLLGLVKLHPGVSGYELRRIISQSTQFFVNAQLSQIYPALKQMTADGLTVFDEVKTEGGRLSKRYYLSPAGEARYLEWLREPIDFTLSLNMQRLFLLKLTFIGSLPKSEQIDYIQNALDYFRFEKERLEERPLDLETEYLSPNLPEYGSIMGFWQWEMELILAHEGHLIAWLERILRELEGQSDEA